MPEKFANKSRDPMQIKDAHARRRLMEEKKERERAILKKKLAAAVDLVGEGEEINLTKAKKRNLLKEWWQDFLNFLDSIKPFRKDINDITVNYDKSIGIFFQICQFLFIYQLITAVIYSPLIVRHFLNHYEFDIYSDFYGYASKCGYSWPCTYFFSRLDESLGWLFVVTNLTFLGVGLIYTL